jgi:hypothetical protein
MGNQRISVMHVGAYNINSKCSRMRKLHPLVRGVALSTISREIWVVAFAPGFRVHVTMQHSRVPWIFSDVLQSLSWKVRVPVLSMGADS